MWTQAERHNPGGEMTRLAQSVALSAYAVAVRPDVRIRSVVGVTRGAVGSSGSLARDPIPTSQVLGVRDRLQMGRVHAYGVPAKVVELQSYGDRPDQEFIGHSVGLRHPAFMADLPVASTGGRQPRPTLTGTTASDLRPEPILQGPLGPERPRSHDTMITPRVIA